jgi:hypothetical protein
LSVCWENWRRIGADKGQSSLVQELRKVVQAYRIWHLKYQIYHVFTGKFMKPKELEVKTNNPSTVTEIIPMPQSVVARQQRLGKLHAAITAKQRFDQPPAHDEQNWVKGVMDVDHKDGTTTHGIPIWSPKAELEAWERLRFPASFHEVDES